MESKDKRHILTVIEAMKDEEGEYMFAAGEKMCSAILTVTGKTGHIFIWQPNKPHTATPLCSTLKHSNTDQALTESNYLLSQGGAIKKPLHNLVVADSQTAVLQCEVANPSAEGRWLKDGQPVDLNENVVSEVDGAVRRLVIIITKATDIGEYTYQVATSKTTATLKVEGRSRF